MTIDMIKSAPHADPLTIWLEEHPNLADCVKITYLDGSGSHNNQTRLEILGEITNKFHFNILACHPEKPHIPKCCQYFDSDLSFNAHKHYFLQNKLYKIRCKTYNKTVKSFNELIDALDVSLQNPDIQVTFNYINLVWKLSEDSIDGTKISNYDSKIVNLISSKFLDLSTDFLARNQLIAILKKMESISDPMSMLFPENEFQTQFNSLLMHPDFKLHSDIVNVMNLSSSVQPKDFTNQILKVMKSIIQFYKIKTKADIFTLSVALFRLIFEESYIIKPQYFNSSVEQSRFRRVSRNVTPSMLCIPEYVQKKFKENNSITDIINSDPILQEAAKNMTCLCFLISPLDILAGIHFILISLRDYIQSVAPPEEACVPFDVIFSLYFCILSASDLPNPESVFNAALQFAPSSGLSGPLEYARSTAAACNIQMEAFTIQLSKCL